MKVYFDACVIIDIGLGGERAAALLTWAMRAAPIYPLFTDFAMGEVASAIAQRVRSDRMSVEQARSSLAIIDEGLASWRKELIQPEDIAAASEMLSRFEVNIRLPDAIHAAAARRLGTTLLHRGQEAGCRRRQPRL